MQLLKRWLTFNRRGAMVYLRSPHLRRNLILACAFLALLMALGLQIKRVAAKFSSIKEAVCVYYETSDGVAHVSRN